MKAVFGCRTSKRAFLGVQHFDGTFPVVEVGGSQEPGHPQERRLLTFFFWTSSIGYA